MVTSTRHSLSISISLEIYSNLKYWALLHIPSNSTLSHKWWMFFLCNFTLSSVTIRDHWEVVFQFSLLRRCRILLAASLSCFDRCCSSSGNLYPVGNWFLTWIYENLTPFRGLGLGQLFAVAPEIMCMVVAVPAHLFHWHTLHCFHCMEVEEYWWILAVLLWRQLTVGRPVFQGLCCLHKREDRSQT